MIQKCPTTVWKFVMVLYRKVNLEAEEIDCGSAQFAIWRRQGNIQELKPIFCTSRTKESIIALNFEGKRCVNS